MTLAQAIYAAAYVAMAEHDALHFLSEPQTRAAFERTQQQAIERWEAAQALWAYAEQLGLTDDEKAAAHRWAHGDSI